MLCKELLGEAELRKKLPALLKTGELIPLSKVAQDLGLTTRTLSRRKDVKTVKVGGRGAGERSFMIKTDAAEFKRTYPETKIRRKKSAAVVEQQPAGKAMKIRATKTTKTVGKKAWQWFNAHRELVSPAHSEMLEKMVRQCENLPLERWDKVVGWLERAFFR